MLSAVRSRTTVRHVHPPDILYRGLRTAGGMCTFTLGSDDLVNARYPAASSRNAAALAKCGVTELPPTRKLRQLMVSYIR